MTRPQTQRSVWLEVDRDALLSWSTSDIIAPGRPAVRSPLRNLRKLLGSSTWELFRTLSPTSNVASWRQDTVPVRRRQALPGRTRLVWTASYHPGQVYTTECTPSVWKERLVDVGTCGRSVIANCANSGLPAHVGTDLLESTSRSGAAAVRNLKIRLFSPSHFL